MPISSPNKKTRFAANDVVWRAAMTTAVIAGAFTFLVSSLLIVNYLQVQAANPLDNPALVKLRAQLADAASADEQLVQQVRTMDLLSRRAFFTQQSQLKMGGYLLLGAVVLLVVAMRVANKARPRLVLPEAGAPRSAFWITQARSRELIAFTGMLWVVAALIAAWATRLDIPRPEPATTAAEAPAAAPAAPAYPDWEAMRQQWPALRGPGGNGVATFSTAPTEWDAATGKNIKWKVEIPLPGANSPVVWGKRVFMIGATESAREVYCFDTESGQLAWKKAVENLPGTPPEPPRVGEETGFAASTMAVQGDRAMALFANGDLVCLDFEGNIKWSKSLGLPDNHYGHSSSLIAWKNLLLVQFDQKKNGKLMAFEIADGKEAWSAPRAKISWSTPICVPTPAGDQLVLNSAKDVDAYDPLTGATLWKMTCLDGEVAPSPAYGAGMFFVANDNAVATAIRFAPDQKPPKPEQAWQYEDALPDVASPLCTDTHFYLATSRGQIVCLDATTGKEAWLQEYDNGFYASPILVGDRIYATDIKGTTFVFKTGAAYELIAKSDIGEDTSATPAFMDGRIYMRTLKQLFCIAAG